MRDLRTLHASVPRLFPARSDFSAHVNRRTWHGITNQHHFAPDLVGGIELDYRPDI